MTREELDEGAALEESARVKGVVLYDEDEPPALGESMPKIVGTRERDKLDAEFRRAPMPTKPWHQEMDEHFAAGGDLDTPPGGPYPFEAEPDPSSDPEQRVRNITFVGGSYREAPRVVPPETEPIEPLSCEAVRAAWRGYQILEGGFAGYVASIIIYWLLS